MIRPGLFALALVLLPPAASPALAQRIVQLAAPTQEPEAPPARPVGDPDIPPISLDLFDTGTSREEAWPWPLPTTDN